MYLRRIARRKAGSEHGYWAVVESRRTQRGPRQHVVAYLGDVSNELQKGALDAASEKPRQGDLFEPAEPEFVEIDIKRVRVECARSFGGSWLGLELMKELGLDSFLETKMDVGRAEVAWNLVAQILVVQRLTHPSSELGIAEGGYEKTALQDILGVPAGRVNDDRLYRALDRLLPHKAELETHLKARVGELFGLRYDLLLYDVTSTFFEGKAERNPQAKLGYSRDSRGDCKQVTIALVVSREGFPLGYEVFEGNRADVTTVENIVEIIESRYGAADRVWAMDRGMVSEENVQFLKEGNRRYILGSPKPSMRAYEKQLASGDWEFVREGLEVQKCASPDGQETFILCRSAKRKLKAKDLERRIGRLLGKNSRAEHLFEVVTTIREDGGTDLSWSRREDVRAWSELSEGCYMLRTNVNDWSAEDLWKAYIQLTQAEAAFSICKNDLSLRPVWHQKEERVKAHILVCFLAYALWKVLDLKCRNAGLGDSARKVLDEISAIQMVDVVMPTKRGIEIRRRCVSVPEPHLAILLHKLKLELPRTAAASQNVVKTLP